jgi:hypothetical protein
VLSQALQEKCTFTRDNRKGLSLRDIPAVERNHDKRGFSLKIIVGILSCFLQALLEMR